MEFSDARVHLDGAVYVDSFVRACEGDHNPRTRTQLCQSYIWIARNAASCPHWAILFEQPADPLMLIGYAPYAFARQRLSCAISIRKELR